MAEVQRVSKADALPQGGHSVKQLPRLATGQQGFCRASVFIPEQSTLSLRR
jgi:hypothetical protein